MVPHEQTQPSYKSELTKATAGSPDVLVALSYPESAGVYVREALEGDYIKTFLFADGTKSPEMNEKIGADKLEGTWGTNKKILAFHDLDISGQPSGTSMCYKITTHNQSAGSKETKIHATSIGWK